MRRASARQLVLGQTLPGFNFLVGSQSQPNVIINALHAVTDVKVLSNPSLVVTDNQVATLMVGDDVPISTGTANVLTTQNTIVNTIDYRTTGIILRVVPRVSANGNVRLEIEQEISQVSNSARLRLDAEPDADHFATQGQELDLRGDRPDRAAGRIDPGAEGT